MRGPQGWEWLIILAIVLLLFGAKRLPDAARGLGRSLRILKAETKGLHDDEAVEAPHPQPAPAPLPAGEAPRSGIEAQSPASVDVTNSQHPSQAPEATRRPTA